MNPTSNPASNTGSPNGYPTRTAQSLNTQTPSTQAQGTNRQGAQNAGIQNTGAHSLPALLIPEDYRARAVALHARELILRSPQMSAIALNGFSGGFGAGFSAGFEKAGERPPAEGSTVAGSATASNANAANGGLLQESPPLREILENAVDEAIHAIDGGCPENTLGNALGNASAESARGRAVRRRGRDSPRG